MHISDGVLPEPVIAAGWVITIILLLLTLRLSQKQRDISEQIPKVSVITGAFFVASLINVPVPPTSVHLILNGLVGVVLGLLAFPSIFVGLTLQAILFQHGGITTIGINAVNMGIPALLAYGLFRAGAGKGIPVGLIGGFAGGFAVVINVVFLSLSLMSAGDAFMGVAKVAAASHVPIIVIETLISGAVVSFFAKVKPELLPLDTGLSGDAEFKGMEA